ncbi:hypothetical protein Pogu_0018 [Pyrobaculum oguniense TE7]|uniref:Uncharacterized protein n=1 Tax=Pyrobaculum oguniense (strain DSM 13380 / JCM 10595 / TE7) TaxID=698757 RepID=H6Q615_PYROT|nr:hypothetical protein Pogu_0018 [Pyrobaculum oguniense TE7]
MAKEANCGEYVKSATGWACVEALAVYCVWDDTIYYDVNRTQQYVEGLFGQTPPLFSNSQRGAQVFCTMSRVG